MGVGKVWKAPNLSSGQTAHPPSAACTRRPFKPAQKKLKPPQPPRGCVRVCVYVWGAAVHRLLNRINLTVEC